MVKEKIFTKKEIILILIYISIISLFLTSVFFNGWSKSWIFINIPPMEPFFSDMRIIQGALKTELLGLNPYITNPGDPWNRMINYPSIWMDIAKILNLENENFFLMFNIFMISIFFINMFVFVIKNKIVFIIFSLSFLAHHC